MYDNRQKTAYRSIKAPAEMREKVLDACEAPQKKSSNIYKFSGLAACLAVFIAAALIFGTVGFADSTVIYTNGTKLTEEPVALPVMAAQMSARAVTGITLEAEIGRNSEVHTSEGNVYVFDAETGEELSGRLKAEKVTLVWDIVPTDIEKTYVLTIENSRGATEVTLLFNEAAGWQLCCIQK